MSVGGGVLKLVDAVDAEDVVANLTPRAGLVVKHEVAALALAHQPRAEGDEVRGEAVERINPRFLLFFLFPAG